MGAVHWAILTGEYPPEPGGVSDYTSLVANELARTGDQVTVLTSNTLRPIDDPPGVRVVRTPGHFRPRDLLQLDGELRRLRPTRILVQYVPHAFGYKGLNLPFAVWLATRARRIAPLWVMFHEVAFPFRWRWPNLLLGSGQGLMAHLVAMASSRNDVSVPAWTAIINRLAPRAAPCQWAPVPSTIPIVAPASQRHTGQLVGHFGTYSTSITDLLEKVLLQLLRGDANRTLRLLGRGSREFLQRFVSTHTGYHDRLHATGELADGDVAEQLSQCDCLIQPYVDGVSSRRTSFMAGLANGLPMVTNLGPSSESFWNEVDCVSFAKDLSAEEFATAAERILRLLSEERFQLGQKAQRLYHQRFSLTRTIARLRGEP